MKEIDVNGIAGIQPVRGGTDSWYYALDGTYGDLYEAQEIYEDKGRIGGSRFFLIRHPDGAVFRPLSAKLNTVAGEPVYHEGRISFPVVDFAAGEIRISTFDCGSAETEEAAAMPLDSVKDCYNLRLFGSPLTLTRQGNDGTLELIWPQRKTFRIGMRESFFHRDGNELYLSDWFEDPDFREETVVRDAESGEILRRMDGDVFVMPDGELWHMQGKRGAEPEILTVRCGDPLWEKIAAFADRSDWRAGPFLARKMRAGDFQEWERVIAASVCGEIVGYCTFTEQDELPSHYGFAPFIGFVYVDERYRGRRFSQKMIRGALRYAEEAGFGAVYLMSGEHGLYEKYGFEKIGEYETVFGTTDQLFSVKIGKNRAEEKER